ncbi:MAG: ribosome silencing factor [Thermoleophilia bacterium]|nr:ribosome silencing factor [Thermoleophilia bacterium]
MQDQDTAALARTLAQTAIEKLATNVRLVDLREIVSYTDWFVVCTGANSRQTKAISDHVVERMKELGHHKPRRRESDADGSWVLLDYTDVVVHIFTPEAREFYRLESLWGQVPQEVVVDDAAGTAQQVAGDTGTERRTAQA